MSRWTKKYVIGLTGSIAAGKGAVRQMLQHLGAYAIDLDRLSQQAIQPGSPAYDPIVEAFGQDVVGDDGQIKRLALAGIITADPSALDRLDAITAPVIDQAVDAMVNHAAQSVIVIEASNLVSSALVKDLDTLWVVDARPEIQLQRLMENRNLSEDAAKQRIIAQGSSADLLQQADVVINNNGALEETWKQVQDAWAVRDQIAQPAPEPASKPKAARERAPEKPQAPPPPISSPLLDEIREWLVGTLVPGPESAHDIEPEPVKEDMKATGEVPVWLEDEETVDVDTDDIVDMLRAIDDEQPFPPEPPAQTIMPQPAPAPAAEPEEGLGADEDEAFFAGEIAADVPPEDLMSAVETDVPAWLKEPELAEAEPETAEESGAEMAEEPVTDVAEESAKMSTAEMAEEPVTDAAEESAKMSTAEMTEESTDVRAKKAAKEIAPEPVEASESVPEGEVHEGLRAESEPETAEIEFASYYPKEIAPEEWKPLTAYVYKMTAADQVEADAEKQFGEALADMRETRKSSKKKIKEGALITATPSLTGFQFNPPSISVGFYQDWHRFDFQLRAVEAPLDQAANGYLTFTVEGLIVADVPLSIFVGESTGETQAVSARQKLYQAIFCSYSHDDTKIVERVERAYKALGLTYLRDVMSLKSGQDWDDQLLDLIDGADVFQLFWSYTAADSPHVRMEWEHALQLGREDVNFIRPVYWEEPMPPVPPELDQIHFAFQPELDD